jgi:hypothetical protein
MIPASHQFRIHKFGQAAPWVDLANSEMWDGYGHLTDFLNDPQWISDFLKFWRFHVPPPGPAALRDLRRLRTLVRQFAEKTSRGAAIQSRDLGVLNPWLKVPVFRRLVASHSRTRTNWLALGDRFDCRFARRGAGARFARPPENLRQSRLRLGIRGSHEGESPAMVQRCDLWESGSGPALPRGA